MLVRKNAGKSTWGDQMSTEKNRHTGKSQTQTTDTMQFITKKKDNVFKELRGGGGNKRTAYCTADVTKGSVARSTGGGWGWGLQNRIQTHGGKNFLLLSRSGSKKVKAGGAGGKKVVEKGENWSSYRRSKKRGV